MHDFDKSGFSILGTLTRDTTRYTHNSDVHVIDLGLRLEDVKKWKLQSERVSYKGGDPAANLRENRASEEEVEFLRDRRVELNAFTSDDFVKWLESKLAEHGVEKIVPDRDTLEAAYKLAAGKNRFRDIIEATKDEVNTYTKNLDVPADLAEKIRRALRKNPKLSWDIAMESIVRRRR